MVATHLGSYSYKTSLWLIRRLWGGVKSIYQTSNPSIYLSIYLSIIYLSIYLSIIYLSIRDGDNWTLRDTAVRADIRLYYIHHGCGRSSPPIAIKCTLRVNSNDDSASIESSCAWRPRWQRQVSRGRVVEPVALLLTAAPPLRCTSGAGDRVQARAGALSPLPCQR